MPSTNPNRLERWLGALEVQRISDNMRDWPGPPIAVHGVPGNVWAMRGGDFHGRAQAGEFMSARDKFEAWGRRFNRRLGVMTRENQSKFNTGFASLSALISQATTQAGARQEYFFLKNGPTGVVAVSSTLWRVGSLPQAGGSSSATPGGRVCTSSTTGALNSFVNATTSQTQHFIAANVYASAQNTLLIYDRLFDVAKTMNSTATESVTGTITRYTSTTSTDADYIGGNFGFIEVGGTALSATAHNWTTCSYTNQAGTTSNLPSVAGTASAIVDRLDQPTNQWFVPYASGDTGIKNWTQLQCSAAVASGIINFCTGHPIAWCPCPVATIMTLIDGVNTAFNLVRIFDNACIAFLEVCKPATTATNYTGSIITCTG